MRAARFSQLGFAILAAAAILSTTRSPRAAIDAAEQARRNQVVAKVGSRSVTVGEIENRLAVIPRYQLLDQMGGNPDAIRRKLLNDVMIPELLLADGADAKNLAADPEVARKIDQTNAEAAEHHVENDVGLPTSISDNDVQAYYDAHKAAFDSPQILGLWRILCKTPEEARAVLADASKDGTPKHFGELARDHSQDKATAMRSGNLGFVAPDGTSNEAGLKVDPVLYAAAEKVADGAFVAEPVPEQGMFAVLWRRGSKHEMHHTVKEAAGQIRDLLWKERFKDAVKKLETDLRAAHLKEENASLVDAIEIDTDTAAIVGRKRPGQVQPITQPVTKVAAPKMSVTPPVVAPPQPAH